jgi:hypothetical protein
MASDTGITRRGITSILSGIVASGFYAKQAAAIGVRQDVWPEVYSRSGDDDLDLALIAELKSIVSVLEVNPGFKYIDQNNAIASTKTMVPGTKGTVFIGLPLIKLLMARDDGGASVAGVCAHECGLIYQFDRGLNAELNRKSSSVIPMELHADFLSGYYFSKRKAKGFGHFLNFLNLIRTMGDNDFHSEQHHGTPDQRAVAVDRGYNVGIVGKSLEIAARDGVRIVFKIIGT